MSGPLRSSGASRRPMLVSSSDIFTHHLNSGGLLEKKEAQGGTAILVVAIEDSAFLFSEVVR